MFLRLEDLSAKKFAGMYCSMSFADNQTHVLWRSFMPRRKEITGFVGTELYSIEVYPPQFFGTFNPAATFEKWAAVEVADLKNIPTGMDVLETPEGLYAVFLHRGPASEGPKTYHYIFETWLPASGYRVGDRPHFAVMGEKYRNDAADSEEEMWIPVCK